MEIDWSDDDEKEEDDEVSKDTDWSKLEEIVSEADYGRDNGRNPQSKKHHKV